LSGANLSGAYSWRNTSIKRSDLRGADLKSSYFSKLDLTKSKLMGADLRVKVSPNLESEWILNEIEWDHETKWPENSNFARTTNIPEALRKQLGL
jgi:hypothetical protein